MNSHRIENNLLKDTKSFQGIQLYRVYTCKDPAQLYYFKLSNGGYGYDDHGVPTLLLTLYSSELNYSDCPDIKYWSWANCWDTKCPIQLLQLHNIIKIHNFSVTEKEVPRSK